MCESIWKCELNILSLTYGIILYLHIVFELYTSGYTLLKSCILKRQKIFLKKNLFSIRLNLTKNIPKNLIIKLNLKYINFCKFISVKTKNI